MESFMNGLTLKDVLHKVIFDSKRFTPRQLASEVGCSYSMLVNAANPELEDFKFAARHILPLTRLTKDFRLLDYMEASCGRVAFTLPELSLKGEERINDLIGENAILFGESLKHIGEALADGEIDDIELKHIERKLTDQVRTAMALLQALKNEAKS
jgi:hypothetical protein